MSKGRFIGRIGKHFVKLRRVDWVLRSLQNSMMLFWQNRYGGLFMIKTHFYILFLSQNTSQMATSLKLNNLGVRKLGNVFLRQGK